MATTKKAKEAKLLTARELAIKAGISPAVLRKLLRQEFNRAGKTVVEGNRAEYRFNPNDSVTYFLFGLCLVGFPSILSIGSFT
jgi:hypothetical protein